jgi:hypothetical protein
MSQLTLRLPNTLRHQLEELAASESISLNQYIIYALTRQVTLSYTVQALPEQALPEQRTAYNALLQNLGEANFEQIQKVLHNRETAEPERGLTPKVVEKLKKRMTKKI